MQAIEWKEQMSVGVQEIDDQHKYFIKLINGLYEAITQGKTEDVLDQTIKKLLGYAKVHFETEEKFMQEIGYAKIDEHRRLHADLFAQVQALYDEHEKFKKIDLSWKVLDFMQNWLVDHLESEDNQYAAYFSHSKTK